MVSALAEVLPDRVGAPAAGTLLVVAFGGKNADGKRYIVGELIAGGSGAANGLDGVDVVDTDASNCMNLPAEAMEMETPIRLNRLSLRAGSGGAGTHRGGLGTLREYEVLTDNVTFTHRGERHFSAARGVFGGGDGARAESVILRADGTTFLGEVSARLLLDSEGRPRGMIGVTRDISEWKAATDALFAQAAHVTKLTVVNNRIVVNSMEGRAALAEYDPATDRSTLYTPTQGVHLIHGQVATALKLDKRIGQYSYLSPGLGIAGGNLERDLATVLQFSGDTGSEAGLIRSFIAGFIM
jgi:N-methylhydantoinase B/oxoprolinase/acetone carboxylase alpha subunit